MHTTTGLTLSPRETPQSVSVITKTQLNDQGMTTIEDALRTTTGVNVTRHGSRTIYQSRGFFIEQIEEDGISTTIGAPGVTGNPATKSPAPTGTTRTAATTAATTTPPTPLPAACA